MKKKHQVKEIPKRLNMNKIILPVVIGLLFSAIIGYLAYNERIFNFSHPHSAILIFTFSGALFLVLLKNNLIKYLPHAFIFSLLLLILSSQSYNKLNMAIRDLVFLSGVLLAAYILNKTLKKSFRWFRGVSAALIFGSTNLIMGLINIQIQRLISNIKDINAGLFVLFFFIGMIVGLSISLGNDTAEVVTKKKK